MVLPSTAGEAKGLLKTAIRDNNPVIFFEHKMLYTTTFDDVPEVEEDVCIPFGKARIVQEGTDITVVTNSMMTVKATKALKKLQAEGISAVSYTHLDVYKRQVMPTQSMRAEDADYAVSFAVPMDTPGITMIIGRQSCDTRKRENTDMDVGNSEFGGVEALTIFDEDVYKRQE